MMILFGGYESITVLDRPLVSIALFAIMEREVHSLCFMLLKITREFSVEEAPVISLYSTF